MTNFKFFLVFLFTSLPFFSKSQEITITPLLYPLDQNTNIVAMCQDQIGFIWLADNFNGLIRYDGSEKKYYRSNPLEINSLSSNRLECLSMGKGNVLWVGTIENGLNRLDLNTEHFTRFQNNPDDSTSIVSDLVLSLLEDREGTLWVGTDKGLDSLDKETGKFVHVFNPSPDGILLKDAEVRVIYEDKEGIIWVGCGNPFRKYDTPTAGLYKIEKASGKITRYSHDSLDKNSLIDNKIRAIFEDSRGTFYVGSAGDGLHIMDREKGVFQRCLYNPDAPNQLSRPPVNLNANYAVDHITFINEDNQGHIWIGTYAGGINRYNPDTKSMDFFGKSGKGPQKLSTNNYWTSLKTADDLFWIASFIPEHDNEVLLQVSTFQHQYEYIDVGKRVTTFAQDFENGIWIGTEKGLEGKDVNDGSDSFFSLVQNTVGENQITNFSFDNRNNLWIAIHGGLYFFERQGNRFTFYSSVEGDVNSLSSSTPTTVLPNEDGTIWIGTLDGLDVLNSKTGEFKHYKYDPRDSMSLNDNLVRDIYRDSKNRMWVMTSSGLNLYNSESNNFRKFYFKDISPVTSLLEDRYQRIWIGANRSGLYLLDEKQNDFFPFYDSTNLISDKILTNGIIVDDSNFLWLNTDLGLIKINPETKNGVLFGQSWNSNSKNRISFSEIFLSKQGDIFRADTSGYFHFNPKKIQNQYQGTPIPYLNKLFIGNEQIQTEKVNLLTFSLNQSNPLILPFDQNSLTFEIREIDFVTQESEKNLLYKLENYDQNWIQIKAGEIARYPTIPPGEYTLHLKASNRFGKIGIKSISILIMPPWFTRWWAWIAYMMLLSILLYWIYDFLIRRKLAKTEVLRLRELDTVKSRLYTNLTHEFRNPLTVISGIANTILEEPSSNGLKKRLDMIVRNSNSLYRLINQMMDLSKLESGSLPTKMIQDDIIGYLKYLMESFNSYAKSKNIRLHLLTDIEELTMDFDPEKINSIFTNLVGNSIKFTPDGGDIYVKINVLKSSKIEELIELKIQDTGKGISEENLPNIFDRFYQVDNSSTRKGEGSGIGLALTKELVDLLEGTIEVESKEGIGTEFTVILPIRREATKAEAKQLIQELVPIQENFNEDSIEELHDTDCELPLALLIEDNQDVLNYLAICLKGNYRIQMASDGVTGIQKAIDLIPDIIVSDVMMPGKDGFELVEILKHDERTSHIPIILLTAKGDMDSRLEGLEHGADAYLAKPFEKKELEIRLRKLMELRKLLGIRYSALSPIGSPGNRSEAKEDAFIKKIWELVDLNLENEEFGIFQICKELGISRTQLHRKLKALTGKSTSQLIRTIRMQKAKILLKHNDLNISEIGYAVGYGNPSHFTQEFLKEFGEAPSNFRKRE